jgi:hypothetical protein
MVGEIIAALRRSSIVRDIDVIEAVEEESAEFLKVKASIVDGSVLHVREIVFADYSKYSYQWQSTTGETLLRWDNAPHHRTVSTHPDHKHEGKQVVPSARISIEDVLAELAERLERSGPP